MPCNHSNNGSLNLHDIGKWNRRQFFSKIIRIKNTFDFNVSEKLLQESSDPTCEVPMTGLIIMARLLSGWLNFCPTVTQLVVEYNV